MKILSLLIPIAGTLGCSQGPSPTPAPPIAAEPLAADDWRRPFLGRWVVEFWLDSTRTGGMTEPWRAAGGKSVTGSLLITDSLTGRLHNRFRSVLQIDFTPLLGRPMSCFEPGPGTVALAREEGRVAIAFTPAVADCGFSAEVTTTGATPAGTWTESSFAGPRVIGRFRMVRPPGTPGGSFDALEAGSIPQ